MDCPACTEPMIVMELNEIEIDHCIACQGIWFDAGELELLLEGASAKDVVLASLKPDKTNKEKKRRCPICLKKMAKVTYDHDQPLLIDKCPQNHGIWFDKGELEVLISTGIIVQDHRILNLLANMFGKKECNYSGG